MVSSVFVISNVFLLNVFLSNVFMQLCIFADYEPAADIYLKRDIGR